MLALLAGCAVTPPPPDDAPPPGGASPGAAEKPPLKASAAQTIEQYKAEVAHAVLHASAEHTFIGRLPEALKSIVVLQIFVDRNGTAYDVRMFRSNGYRELEARAVQSVRAATLPRPGAALTGGRASVSFTETWLFRDDGKFQIRTLAGPQ